MAKKFINESTGHKTVALECNGRYFERFYELTAGKWRLLSMEEISKDDYDSFQPGLVTAKN